MIKQENNSVEGIVVLGSTGSIGESTLGVIRENPGRFRVDGLSCESNLEKLKDQILEFNPPVVSVGTGKKEALRAMLAGTGKDPEILEGIEGNIALAQSEQCSRVVAAIVGAAGVKPVMAGIQAEKTIALANKEAIVLAGSLMMEEAGKRGVKILPVDSEHNAIFQALSGDDKNDLAYITLTASGGPFRTKPLGEFSKITVGDALNHPNWDMGRKITIDSATMMNKCLEIIEAKWLFDMEPEKIRILVHPQSVVHSMVTFLDGSTIAQMGVPDMKVPIANCLGFPQRIYSGSDFLELASVEQLTFEKPDLEKFPSLRMAFEVLKLDGGAPAALNGANEALVALFLDEKIEFLQIFQLLEAVVAKLREIKNDTTNTTNFIFQGNTIEDRINADLWGRDFVCQLIDSI